MTLAPDLLNRFKAIVGERHAIADPQAQAPYLVEMRNCWHGHTPLVLRPGSVDEVSAILKLANEARIPVVPQGGNTGLVGGQIPMQGEILLSLRRLDKIRELDARSSTVTTEAGVILQHLREEVAKADLLYPQSLPSEGSCTIGGNLAVNAGGTTALAYGIARSHVLGLEVVLADGRVLHDLNKLKKDNTGYDLRNLFIGSEGTLGIITAATLRLVPRPRSVEIAFLGLPSAEAAVELLNAATSRMAGTVTSFELMTRDAVEMVLKHDAESRDPLAGAHPFYVLLEISSQLEHGLRAALEDLLQYALERGLIVDGAIAENLQQGKAFWRIREMLSEVQRHEGGSIKHDISVPVAAIPAFIKETDAAITAQLPGARPLPFGHVGDGNIHYNISQPLGADKAAFMAQEEVVHDIVYGIVQKYHGSISAEHGIGLAKRERLPLVKDKTALELMRAIKRTLDPNNILNPGKLL